MNKASRKLIDEYPNAFFGTDDHEVLDMHFDPATEAQIDTRDNVMISALSVYASSLPGLLSIYLIQGKAGLRLTREQVYVLRAGLDWWLEQNETPQGGEK